MKFLIVDDHAVLRQGLSALLTQLEPDVSIIEARDASEAFSAVEKHDDIDLVTFDMYMPGMAGVSALSEFGRRWPHLPVVVLSSSEDATDIRQALTCGARGYVPKSASHFVLLSAVRLALNGDIYVPPQLLNQIGGKAEMKAGSDKLTHRQVQILALLSDGKPNKVIATSLGLSEKTVKTHVTAIFKALNVINRTQAVSVARAAGMI
jgi:DNA-binding NarL/FixJ family response regulator